MSKLSNFKKGGNNSSSRRHKRSGGRRLTERQIEKMEKMIEDGQLLASGLGRRSKRMKPLDSKKGLVVLMPNDDPVEKVGLDLNEVNEFICCMEEMYEYEPVDDKGVDSHGNGHGKGYNGESSISRNPDQIHSNVVVEDGAEVVVPDSKQGAAQPLQGDNNFILPEIGTVLAGSTYSDYDIDSEDEDFLVELTTRSSKKIKSGTFNFSLNEKTLSYMLIALERELEISTEFRKFKDDIVDAKSLCQDYIKNCKLITEDAVHKNVYCRNNHGGILESEHIHHLVKVLKDTSDGIKSQSRVEMVRSSSVGSVALSTTSNKSDMASMNSDMNSANDSSSSVARNKIESSIRDDLSEVPKIPRESIEQWVPNYRACRMLMRVYILEQNKKTDISTNYNDTDKSSALFAETDEIGLIFNKCKEESIKLNEIEENNWLSLRPFLERIYEYWLDKRSSRRSSLLRCYHSFIMELWKHQEVLPAITEDTETARLLHSHTQMVKLRHDLDRARLIMDRVRRREKVKRELIRISGDTMGDYLATVPQSIEIPITVVKEKSIKEKRKEEKESAVLAARIASNSRQPRAAKAAAKVKIENPGSSSSSSDSKNGTKRNRNDDFDREWNPAQENLISFHLEVADYNNLEIPAYEQHSRNVDEACEDSEEVYKDYDTRRQNQFAGSRFGSDSSAPAVSVATGWTADEDRLLLMGVAACGVGRWTEIREDFLLARNSAQMNQRFTRLARRRCVLVKLNEGSSRKKRDDDEEGNSEYTEVRTAFVSPQDIAHARSKLPPLITTMLEEFKEDSIWESIAVRHLVDQQSKDKRCGRPQKYPLPIPIPKNLQNGGYLTKKNKIMQRPSELGYNWKGTASSSTSTQDTNQTDFGIAGGRYSRGGYSLLAQQSTKTSSSSDQRNRGRPRKSKKGSDDEGCDDVDDDEKEIDIENDDESSEGNGNAVTGISSRDRVTMPNKKKNNEEKKIIEQSQSREERRIARAILAIQEHELKQAQTLEEGGGRGQSRDQPRCSLGSLGRPPNKMRKTEPRSTSDSGYEGVSPIKRGRGRPPLSATLKKKKAEKRAAAK